MSGSHYDEEGLLWVWQNRSNRQGFAAQLAAIELSSTSLCRNDKLAEYVAREGPTSDWILTVTDTRKHEAKSKPKIQNTEPLRGFALIKLLPLKETKKRKRGLPAGFRTSPVPRVFLDVLCARGLGTKMLKSVFAKSKELGYGIVELHTLPDVVGFYRANGFVNAQPGTCIENPEITKAWNNLGKTPPRFKSIAEALANENYQQFLHTLVDYKTAINSKCIGITQNEIGENGIDPGCSYDGYTMNRCLATPLSQLAPPLTQRADQKSPVKPGKAIKPVSITATATATATTVALPMYSTAAPRSPPMFARLLFSRESPPGEAAIPRKPLPYIKKHK